MDATLPTLTAEEISAITEARTLGVPLPRILDEWRRHLPPAAIRRPIGELVSEVYAAKVRSGREPRYCVDLKRYLSAFSAFVGPEKTVDAVSAADIENWFEERNEAPASRASNLGRLGSLFTFAKRKGFLRDHPIDCVERVRIVRREPAILKPAQAADLLRFSREGYPGFLPLIALQLFTGCRPSEAEKTTWENINLEERTLTVTAAMTKVRQRRAAPIHGAGVEWLALTPEAERTGPLFTWSHMVLRRYRRALAEELDIKWTQDILRHTAASCLVAAHEDLGRVARWLGNSPRILQSHYLSVMTRRDAETFLNIRPN